MKKTILIIALSAFIALPIVASAKSTNAANPNGRPSATVSPSVSPSADTNINRGAKNWKSNLDSYKQAKSDKKLEQLKALANTLIENRISLLENLKERITANTKISQTARQEMLTNIETAISQLTTLKATIQSETDLAALKEKVKSIFKDYKIYSVVAPKNLGQNLAAQGQYILGRLEAIQRQLETMLTQNKNAGKDTTAIQPLIDQVTAKLDDAKAQLLIAEEKFKGMTPANTEAAKTAREEGKAAMKKAKQDLKDAHTLLKQISAELKALTASPKPSSSVSPTVSPSTSPSATPSASTSSTPSPSPSV